MLTLELPVTGEWKLIRSPGHHRFAYDLVFVGPGGRRRRSSLGTQLFRTAPVTDALSWEKPVRSPCDAEVVSAENGEADRERLNLFRDLRLLLSHRPRPGESEITPFAGNHVLLRFQDCYVFLAHLRRGSVEVGTGDAVERGSTIGLIGNSGLSLEPHLHLQAFDGPHLLEAGTVPFAVREFERAAGSGWERKRDEPLRKGDRIRSVPA